MSGDTRRNGIASERPVLITGGSGFIGANLANRIASEGRPVLLLDNLSRIGVEQNLAWLKERHGNRVRIDVADVRDADSVARAVARASQVFHFAAQVAVTTSLIDPVEDFEINARGTLNVLEALRAQPEPPPLVFTSTNKVYGNCEDVDLVARGGRYQPADRELRERGISEARPLQFHSPYGCSKGTADQYVLDYAHSYGLRTAVFRMSCIYGPHQFGTEDQGWVAHFLIRAIDGQPISIYGDGKQVRDVLFVEDLVEAFIRAQANIDKIAGTAFNIGGGPQNAISLLDLLDMIEELNGERPEIRFDDWRTGDQRYYVSDTHRFQQATGWRPRVGAREGVEALYQWLVASRDGADALEIEATAAALEAR